MHDYQYLAPIVRFSLKKSAIVWNVTLVSGDLIIAHSCVWYTSACGVETTKNHLNDIFELNIPKMTAHKIFFVHSSVFTVYCSVPANMPAKL